MIDNVVEAFRPRWYSVFFNPFFIIRGRLYKAVERNMVHMQGDLLDFGCGKKPYESMFTVNSYIGVDYETEVSKKNEYVYADVFYDGKTIPFEDNKFDSVFCTEVLEHVFNPDEVLTEIRRVLKPGGKMLLTCPFMLLEHERPYDYARYTSFGLKHLVEKNGFDVINYEKTSSHYEAILQAITLYVHNFIPQKSKVLHTLFFTIFITPFTLLGLLLHSILPKKIRRDDLYLNNVIVVRKPGA